MLYYNCSLRFNVVNGGKFWFPTNFFSIGRWVILFLSRGGGLRLLLTGSEEYLHWLRCDLHFSHKAVV